MFDSLFPKEWTTLQRLMWLKTNALARAVYETITGNPVSFTAKAAPLRKLSVAFSPVQNLNGYDAPWPAGGGKNKFDGNFPDTTGDTIVYFPIAVENGTYTLSSTTPQTSQGFANLFFLAGDVSSGASSSINGVWSGHPYTVTVADGYCTIAYRSYSGVDPRDYNTQLESGSSATSYAPYSNLCPISGWSSLTVEQRGKNLLDESGLVYGAIANNGSFSTSSTKKRSDYIFVKAGTYTASRKTAPDWWKAYQYKNNSDKTPVGFVFNSADSLTQTFTLSEDCFIAFSFDYIPADDANLQIELGSTASSEYVPYNPSSRSISISLGQTVYSGWVDVVTGVGEIDWATVTFDGSEDENWIRHTQGSAGAFAMTIFGLPNADITDVTKACKSNYLKTIGVGATWGNYDYWLSANGKATLVTGIKSITTIEAWKTYLSENPLEVVYELDSPIPIQLTPQEVQSLAGDNTMWTDAQNLEVTYRSN